MTFRKALYLTRPHTLPASAAPVIVALGFAAFTNTFKDTRSLWAGILCLFVAIFAQVFCNIVNDLADFKNGADTSERQGFERPLATGKATVKEVESLAIPFLLLTVLCGVGVLLLSNWWLLPLGAIILIGSYAYSAGPFPLSYHGLGEVAVFAFYGIAAAVGTYLAAAGTVNVKIFCLASAIGFASVNILLINNYRDVEQDAAGGKRTIAVIFGEKLMPLLYSVNICLILFCMIPFYSWVTMLMMMPVILFMSMLSRQMRRVSGSALNKVLDKTAIGVMFLAVTLIAILFVHYRLGW